MTTEQKPVELTAEMAAGMAQRVLDELRFACDIVLYDELDFLQALASGRLLTYDPKKHVLCEREPVLYIDQFGNTENLLFNYMKEEVELGIKWFSLHYGPSIKS